MSSIFLNTRRVETPPGGQRWRQAGLGRATQNKNSPVAHRGRFLSAVRRAAFPEEWEWERRERLSVAPGSADSPDGASRAPVRAPPSRAEAQHRPRLLSAGGRRQAAGDGPVSGPRQQPRPPQGKAQGRRPACPRPPAPHPALCSRHPSLTARLSVVGDDSPAARTTVVAGEGPPAGHGAPVVPDGSPRPARPAGPFSPGPRA